MSVREKYSLLRVHDQWETVVSATDADHFCFLT
jgi:hypothetical protein